MAAACLISWQGSMFTTAKFCVPASPGVAQTWISELCSAHLSALRLSANLPAAPSVIGRISSLAWEYLQVLFIHPSLCGVGKVSLGNRVQNPLLPLLLPQVCPWHRQRLISSLHSYSGCVAMETAGESPQQAPAQGVAVSHHREQQQEHPSENGAPSLNRLA